ncbi:MAG: AmmeMemoRadiSam system protein B [archaeon]|nr:AmmeMemoRadiSam system protein B [archaeon]MCP8315978.1 AmmeMemoRadiSam system protein B [archaeon]
MRIRRPAVAGIFYPLDSDELKASIEESFLHKIGPRKKPPSNEVISEKVALVSPHAGYMYSGPVAAHGYYACSYLKSIELVVIAGPNHHGIGSGVATVREGVWETPLGKVEVDGDSAKLLVELSGIVDFDDSAHRREHSIEVQIPFLQYIYGNKFKILPISMMLQDISTAVDVGKAIADCVRDKKFLLIASSDFTHYEAQGVASRKDSEAIKAILQMDIPRLYDVIENLDITMCGYGPIATIITAAKELNITKGRLLQYATSGDITGDYSSVVGYASILFQ